MKTDIIEENLERKLSGADVTKGSRSIFSRFKRTVASVLAGLSLLMYDNESAACTGPEQLAMGGAGVAYCDNSDAIYWNQANLANVNPEVSYQHLFVGSYRYDNVINAVTPFHGAGLGIQCMNSETGDEKWKWVKLGIGTPPLGEISFGFDVSLEDRQDVVEVSEKSYSNSCTEIRIYDEEKDKTALGFDLSVLTKRQDFFIDGSTFRLGYLVQMTPKFDGSYGCNFRPGLSWTLPFLDGELTGAFEYYNLKGGKNEYQGGRYGLEYKIHNLSLRAGKDEAIKALTAGFGFDFKDIGLDVAYLKDDSGEDVVYAKIGLNF